LTNSAIISYTSCFLFHLELQQPLQTKGKCLTLIYLFLLYGWPNEFLVHQKGITFSNPMHPLMEHTQLSDSFVKLPSRAKTHVGLI